MTRAGGRMVRPRKSRYLSPYVRDHFFSPRGVPRTALQIADLKGDEVEAMRLCDREELEQVAAGRRMGISRPTVQRLLYSGRKKVVDALIEGKAIQITFPKYISFHQKRG
ncbi:MAG: DUF134 domain-containing protein [Candidatus Margulisbacteria bacterium]|nr:DUF134 domain-containing protein [Candidatus Margulisiibacteriota bacterium]